MERSEDRQLMELFNAAADLAPDEQRAFLAQANVGNYELRSRLEALLMADREPLDYRLKWARVGDSSQSDHGLKVDFHWGKREAETFSANELLVSGSVFGQYELIRELGRGGMSVVFLARDVRLGRRVTVKFLVHEDSSLAERFLAEARVTARCKHDNIVDIYDVGEAHGYYYMVLEYLEGITLRAWMRKLWESSRSDTGMAPKPVSAAMAVQLMIPVVRALLHAHERGMVHRDLKPENIMLADNGSIKVLDFGIAKVLDRKAILGVTDQEFMSLWAERRFETHRSAIVGTMPYMSPEQWGTADVDERSDIWAVGIIFWELLTGQHPLAPLSPQVLMAVRDLNVSMPSMSGTRPDIGKLGNIVDRCLRKRVIDRIHTSQALLDELEPFSTGSDKKTYESGQPGDTINPFAGLAPFQETDAGRFFGRDDDIASMINRMSSQPLVTVVGPSGAGKSSFIRAGVIPGLRRLDSRWQSFVVRPGRKPLSALADVILQVPSDTGPTKGHNERETERLREQPGSLGARLRAYCRHSGHRILLFVDQFEELYTLSSNPELRAAFVACLEGVADDASSPLRVVLALRIDFLEGVAKDRVFMSEITRGLMFLPPMERDSLRQALTRPVQAVGYAFETADLVETMLNMLEVARSPLPLLQFTAAKLWETRDRKRRILSEESYDQLGGVAGALAAHADAVLAGLPRRELQLARMIFSSLVTDERTRAIISLQELRALGPSDTGDTVEHIIYLLASARLILIETDAEQGSTVELVHESLIDSWPTLGQWLNEDQDEMQFRARLRAAAEAWDKQGRTEDLLWHGQVAYDASRWLTRWSRRLDTEQSRVESFSIVQLGARDHDFLRAVVDLAARAKRRRWRAAIFTIISLGIVIVVVALLALQARREATHADEQAAEAKNQAKRAAREAARARNSNRMATARALQHDPTTVLALLRDVEPPELPHMWFELARWPLYSNVAQRVFPHTDGVHSAVFGPDGTRIMTIHGDRSVQVWNVDGSGSPLIFDNHKDDVTSAEFNADGTRIVTASKDSIVRVWSSDGMAKVISLSGHQQHVWSASFSSDGTHIVTASSDKTARVWNADGSGKAIRLPHSARVNSAAFSPDGTRVVTASADNLAWVWNINNVANPRSLNGHRGPVYSAKFSPDGTRIVTASSDKTARVWNADGSGDPYVYQGHQKWVWSAEFSPDGTRIVTTSGDSTAHVWNADGSGQPLIFRGHQGALTSAKFSPDGTQIVTASGDKAVRLWNADGSGRLVVLRGHKNEVHWAEFSPDGTQIATASEDGSVRVWNADGSASRRIYEKRAGHKGVVFSAKFSPDGTRIVTASADKSARVWTADGSLLFVLRGHKDKVASAAFSPDGTRIVTASADKTARVWTADGSLLFVLRGHTDWLSWAEFSPDGTRIVTASWDATARVWSASGSSHLVVLRGHESRIHRAQFSPDGTRIVTASADKTARVWTTDGSPLFALSGHRGEVHSAGFSSDGTRIVTASGDRTARVWTADGSGQFLALHGHDEGLFSAEFSPDGLRIVTASRDNTTRVWTDLKPLSGVGDRRLWTATSYCIPISLQMELLGVSADIAHTCRNTCLHRVRKATTRRAGDLIEDL